MLSADQKVADVDAKTQKLDSVGVVYQYSDDMLDEFMRQESVWYRSREKKVQKQSNLKRKNRIWEEKKINGKKLIKKLLN